MNKPKEPRKTSELEKKIKTASRHTLTSFLPGKVQEKIARKHDEDTEGYLLGTIMSETIVGSTVAIVGAVICPPAVIAGFGILGDALFNAFRLFPQIEDKTCGHPITTIPYHAVKQPYKLGNYLKNKISRKGEKK